MKKNILIFIFLIFSFSSIFSNPFDDDCTYLKTLFSDVAIDMSLALEEKNLTTHGMVIHLVFFQITGVYLKI